MSPVRGPLVGAGSGMSTRAPKKGPFLGRQKNWRRISEVWDGDGLTEDAAVEAAERLGAYIEALEPLRRAGARKVKA